MGGVVVGVGVALLHAANSANASKTNANETIFTAALIGLMLSHISYYYVCEGAVVMQ
jgi:hypothetical protein